MAEGNQSVEPCRERSSTVSGFCLAGMVRPGGQKFISKESESVSFFLLD